MTMSRLDSPWLIEEWSGLRFHVLDYRVAFVRGDGRHGLTARMDDTGRRGALRVQTGPIDGVEGGYDWIPPGDHLKFIREHGCPEGVAAFEMSVEIWPHYKRWFDEVKFPNYLRHSKVQGDIYDILYGQAGEGVVPDEMWAEQEAAAEAKARQPPVQDFVPTHVKWELAKLNSSTTKSIGG